MGTAGNRASTGVNVRAGGASLGNFTVQAIPPINPASTVTLSTALTTTLAVRPSILNNAATATALNINRSLFTVSPFVSQQAINVIPPLIRGATLRSSDEILSVSHLRVTNTTFVPISVNGISSLRPEIVSLIDFKPIVADNERNPTKAGRLLDLQFQAKSLREKTLLDLVNNIRGNQTTANDLDQIQTDFSRQFRSIDQVATFYNQTIDTIEILKQSLDIKHIPDNLFDTSNFETLRSFYAHRMEFPASSFDVFANTKLLYQMMFDFRSIMENYSLNLLNLNDPDRTHDSNPILIDKSYTTSNGFSFTLNQIRSTVGNHTFGTTAQNAAIPSFFSRFQSSLPQVADDRIKLLITLFSKELRVSRGLGDSDVARVLINGFGAGTTTTVGTNNSTALFGNVFDNLIGTVGNTALDPPLGTNGLSSLFFLDGTNNSFVLPFETKYIDVNTAQTTYIPGSNYFIDSILNISNNNFNITPFLNYVQKFTDTLSSANNIIMSLFDFKETPSELSGTAVFRWLVQGIVNSMDSLGTTTQMSIGQASNIALFRLTSYDNQLKQMLFQHTLLRAVFRYYNRAWDSSDAGPGVTYNNQVYHNTVVNSSFLIQNIMTELGDFSGLSFLQFDQNADLTNWAGNVTSYLRQLESTIQRRVIETVNNYFFAYGGAQPVRPTVNPRVRDNSNSDTAQTTNIRNSNGRYPNAPDAENHSPSDSSTRPVGSNRIRLGFDVDSVSSITSALGNNPTLIDNFLDAVMQLSKAASIERQFTNVTGATSTVHDSNYVDPDGKTLFHQLSATTMILMLFEAYCNLIYKYTSSDFTKSDFIGTCDMLIDPQFNDISIANMNAAIAEPEVVLGPSVIGNVGTQGTVGTTSGTPTTTGGNALAGGGSAPGNITVSADNGDRLSDISRRANRVDTNLLARNAGISPGQAIAGVNANAQYIGMQRNTNTQRVTNPAVLNVANVAQNPSYMLSVAQRYSSLISIKQKIFEEDLAIANILHILTVIHRRITNARERIINYFTPATITNFLNQSRTATNDLSNILNPGQVRVIAHTKDAINRQLRRTGEHVEFVSSTPNEINVKNSIISLLAQPDYQERNLAEEKIKIITVGVPALFSKNLADRVNTGNLNRTSFVGTKDFDVIRLQVHKRNLEHEELVFKPKIFLFDLSLFEGGFQNLNVSPQQDFNNIIQAVRLADYQQVSNPVQVSLTDINNDEKYSFLTTSQKQTMFKNHVVSDLLNSYISYMTAMRMSEDVFVDIHSTTYNRLKLVNDIQGSMVSPLTTLSADFQTKIIRFLNVVKHKNIPNRPIADLLTDNTVDQESKDILRTVAFGNIVFNPNYLMQNIASPKLFDRVFTMPINVDSFPIDVDMTNSTSVGRMVLDKLYQQQGALTVPDSNGDVYLAPRDKNSPVFEDYFITIDLVSSS